MNTVSAYNELEAMHKNIVKNLIFLSSSAYGLADPVPTPETYDPLITESLYASSKLASKGVIAAFAKYSVLTLGSLDLRIL
ncbi:MAG: NAD-dependent epimerase/dehydratase family protein [Candidatus Micrarchaeia archaeon]